MNDDKPVRDFSGRWGFGCGLLAAAGCLAVDKTITASDLAIAGGVWIIFGLLVVAWEIWRMPKR